MISVRDAALLWTLLTVGGKEGTNQLSCLDAEMVSVPIWQVSNHAATTSCTRAQDAACKLWGL